MCKDLEPSLNVEICLSKQYELALIVAYLVSSFRPLHSIDPLFFVIQVLFRLLKNNAIVNTEFSIFSKLYVGLDLSKLVYTVCSWPE